MTHKRFSEKEILKIRNDIFIQDVVPILEKKGFVKSPFKTACFGRTSNNNIFIYEMCRLRKDSRLEFVITKISRYDRYIKIYKKFNILQHIARQIDTKCLKNRKKV